MIGNSIDYDKKYTNTYPLWNNPSFFIADEYSMDLSHGKPHYYGIIKYIGQKI